MPKTKTRVADLQAWQEFRIGGIWYMNLLPPLCRYYGQTGQRWCLNLRTWKEDSLLARARVDEVR